MDWMRILRIRRQKKPEAPKGNTGTLWLAWPPTNIPPETPILWLRYSNGAMAFLDTGSSRLVPLFLTTEAAKVVAIALQNRFGSILEIRAVTGISRSDFGSHLRESGEFPQWNGEYRIICEDDHLFIGLCHILKIAVGIKTGTHLAEDKILASIKEITE